MTTVRPPRGFTLLELMIAMFISILVLTMAVAAANLQQRAYYSGQRDRTAQEEARTASIFLQQKLPQAGYGVDATLAIDFSYHGCATQVGCLRDSTGGPDELVFYARNPEYWVPQGVSGGTCKGHAWSLKSFAADNSSATLVVHEGDTFLPGQILQAICPQTLNYAYFTVSAAATKGAGDGELDVPLEPVVLGNPFRRQDVAVRLGLTSCPDPAGATMGRVFQIDTYRFYINPVAVGGGRTVPYLMLDRGGDEVVVAEGIEDMQVAYVFSNPALGTAGIEAETPITFTVASLVNGKQETPDTDAPNRIARTLFLPPDPLPALQTEYVHASFYQYKLADPIRQTHLQANIRAIRVALVARSPDPDVTTRSSLVVDSDFTLFNQKGAPTWVTDAPKLAGGTDGYQRVVVDFTVDLPNMMVRALPGF